MDKWDKTLFIAGDSTAATKSDKEKPMSGWGEFLSDHFNDKIRIKNHAINGRSTKSFIEQKRLEPIFEEAREGDYLLIQFGHNDQKADDESRFTSPFTTYKENLKFIINQATVHHMTPVLLTSISRRQFIDGELQRDSLGDYPEAMRAVAEETDTLLIDMHQLSSDYLNQLGDEASKKVFLHLGPNEYVNYPEGLTDNTHFSEQGAKQMANLLLKEIKLQLPEIGTFVADKVIKA